MLSWQEGKVAAGAVHAHWDLARQTGHRTRGGPPNWYKAEDPMDVVTN